MQRLTIVLLLTLFAISCSESEVVNIYSSRHYDTDQELFDNFTEQTGIQVNLIEGSSDELIERILNEGGNSPADIIITVDAGLLTPSLSIRSKNSSMQPDRKSTRRNTSHMARA